MNSTRTLAPWEFVRMANAEPTGYTFQAWGLFSFGDNLARLEWAVATITGPTQLAPFIEAFRVLDEVKGFEDIGREAINLHNLVSNLTDATVSDTTKNSLRSSITRWSALFRERLSGFLLVTPDTLFEPHKLMEGIDGLLAADHVALLSEIEKGDLDQACRCLLTRSFTASEFIALRAAEGILRRWYIHKTGKEIAKAGWGTVLNRLVKEYPDDKRPMELVTLQSLKQRRDAVAHPDKVSDGIDAEATLLNIRSLIKDLHPVLEQLPGLSVEQPPLALSEEQSETDNNAP